MQNPMLATSHHPLARTVLALGASLIALLGVTTPAQAANAPVRTASTASGVILVNAQGRTMYAFAADPAGRSTCTGACAKSWPPVIAAAKGLTRPSGVSAKLTVVKRADGASQLAVNGRPMYTYVGDRAPGQTNGQGVNASGGLWWVISPKGALIKSTRNPAAPAPSGTGQPTGTGGVYDYY